jgi:hypothetical protein
MTRERLVAFYRRYDPDEVYYSYHQVSQGVSLEHPAWSLADIQVRAWEVFQEICQADQERFNSQRRFFRLAYLSDDPDQSLETDDAD